MKATVRIDMPNRCVVCPLTLQTQTMGTNNTALRCLALGREVDMTRLTRDPDCPLVEVEHNDT